MLYFILAIMLFLLSVCLLSRESEEEKQARMTEEDIRESQGLN